MTRRAGRFTSAKKSKNDSLITFSFEVEVSEFDGGFEACSPDLPGVTSWGKTRRLALSNIENAIVEHLNLLIENDGPVPESIAKQAQEQSLLILQSTVTKSDRPLRDMQDSIGDRIEFAAAM